MPKYKINDKVYVKVFNFTDTECVFVNGVIEGIDETTESGKTYRVYIPKTNDILYARDCDIIRRDRNEH